jgi:hypothetical protein
MGEIGLTFLIKLTVAAMIGSLIGAVIVLLVEGS